MFTRPFHTSYRAASQRSWQRMNRFRRRRSQCVVIDCLRRRIGNRLCSQFGWCPFSNLPAPGRNRWDQGLTAAEMRRCRWVKPAMVARSDTRNGRGMIGCGTRRFAGFAKPRARPTWSGKKQAKRFEFSVRSGNPTPWTECCPMLAFGSQTFPGQGFLFSPVSL